MTVQVNGRQVETGYSVASTSISDTRAIDLDTIPPDSTPPVIVGDVVLFIHGHSSRLEEVESLVPYLYDRGAARRRPVTIIAMGAADKAANLGE